MKILKPADAFDKSAKIYQGKFMDVRSYKGGWKPDLQNCTPGTTSTTRIRPKSQNC
ncbi:hypothetical protein ACTJKN_09300 [Pedobacter sp. 22163]|uniref:hypothetical protein n=1 Tax=Pedobacter sp. 22163 TaxID=3453883 RepID=UPI003F83591D